MSRKIPTPTQGSDHPVSGCRVIKQYEEGEIHIGESIHLVVLAARDGKARIGIRAPRHLEITAPKQ
ncbi:carbon storage regulator [Stenotrophomonas maltophilia]|uniref:carbon storage regulator n=1 Tax=Stenotrophomonas maltophilia TaxID=40324 RepID=UPI0015DFEBCB|nr:carbon storage regulator [Stenotrophomonas maltophilia]MCM2518555.1 carbon storage regulator [Stenotrophomonas maltophilia]